MIPVFAMMAAGPAYAQTSAGTLITNVATATEYFSHLGLEYSASYSSTVIVLVAQPDIQLQKVGSPTLACSGGTVTFCIWAVNASAFTSAFNVVVDDLMPLDFAYVKGQQEIWSSSGSVTMGYRTLLPTWICCAYIWDDDPPDGAIRDDDTRFKALIWVVDELGPNDSAYICFQARML